jgi:2-haloacid dehalogenase
VQTTLPSISRACKKDSRHIVARPLSGWVNCAYSNCLVLLRCVLTSTSEQDAEHWSNVWHRLKPWPDAVRGLERMKKNYVLPTLSNGNGSLLVEMAKDAGLPWDVVLSAKLFHHFKSDREVHLGAAEMLGCKPAEVMMVAAHPGDLKAAQTCGRGLGLWRGR